MFEKIEHGISHFVEIIEGILAMLILVVLVILVGIETYNIVSNPAVLMSADFLDEFLQRAVTLTVGVEFVKMLLHPTPANIIELLIIATSRHIILNHHDYIASLCGIACIVALFATRRFLVSRKEEKQDVHVMEDNTEIHS